jgi:hypothetical protein
MTQETMKPPDEQNGTDTNRDPTTGTPVGAGVVVAGPKARGRAKQVDPKVENAYWQTNYSKQKYVERNAPYTAYQPAYRTGYEGRSQYPGKKYEEVEADLQRDYEKSSGPAGLNWDKAKRATRDAWDRVEKVLPRDADGDGR